MFVQMTKDWSALNPDSLMTFLYYGGYGWPGPLPITRTLADRMRSYRTLGVQGVLRAKQEIAKHSERPRAASAQTCRVTATEQFDFRS